MWFERHDTTQALFNTYKERIIGSAMFLYNKEHIDKGNFH